jgi:diacylglycerol kinase (ATP)
VLAFLQSRARSFGYAFSGWWYVIRTQRNAWIHTVVSVVVILLSLWLRISRTEWALIVLAIALVWTAEFINTSLEAVVDLASRHEQHALARVGKDVGAAAVLIAAGASIVIGLLVLGPALWAKIRFLIYDFRF